MKKINTDESRNNSKIGYIIIIVLYILGFILYKPIYNLTVKTLTPPIQEKYYVDLKLYDSNGEVASSGDDTYILINPMAKAIAFVLMILVICLLIKIFYVILEKNKLSLDLNRQIKFLETLIIIFGVFVAVYKWSSYDLTTYGIYKSEFNQNTGLGYYKVEKMPVIKDFLYNKSESFFRSCLNKFVVNGEKITEYTSIILVVSGAALLPLKEMMRKENIKKSDSEKEKMIKKLSDDIRSQVLDDINRKNKEEKKS